MFHFIISYSNSKCSLTHSPFSHSLHPTHDPVHSTTLSPCTSDRAHYSVLFHWCRNKCEQPSQFNETKSTIFVSVTQKLRNFLPCASRQNKQCNCNDSYSSSRITIEPCESARKKKRSESEKITVSLFIHTSRINNSEKLVFLLQRSDQEKHIN